MQAGVNSGSRASPTNQTRPRFVLMTERLQIPPLKIYTGYIMNGNNGVKKLVYLKRIKKLRPPPVNHPKVELLRMSSLTVEWSVKVLGSIHVCLASPKTGPCGTSLSRMRAVLCVSWVAATSVWIPTFVWSGSSLSLR